MTQDIFNGKKIQKPDEYLHIKACDADFEPPNPQNLMLSGDFSNFERKIYSYADNWNVYISIFSSESFGNLFTLVAGHIFISSLMTSQCYMYNSNAFNLMVLQTDTSFLMTAFSSTQPPR